MLKISQHLDVVVCENITIKRDWCLRRSASTARDEDAASVNSNTTVLERISDNELERNATNLETNKKKKM